VCRSSHRLQQHLYELEVLQRALNELEYQQCKEVSADVAVRASNSKHCLTSVCVRPSRPNNSMESMFNGAELFNQDLSQFDTSSVVNFRSMFYEARLFNQDISMWNLGSAKFLQLMFASGYGFTLNFNQDLCSWGTKLDKAAFLKQMFWRSGCSTKGDPDLSQTPPGPFCYPCEIPKCQTVSACSNQVWQTCGQSCNAAVTCFTSGVKGCCTDGNPAPAYVENVRAKYEIDYCIDKCASVSVCVAQVWTSCGPSCNITAVCFNNALEGCCPGASTPTIAYKSQVLAAYNVQHCPNCIGFAACATQPKVKLCLSPTKKCMVNATCFVNAVSKECCQGKQTKLAYLNRTRVSARKACLKQIACTPPLKPFLACAKKVHQYCRFCNPKLLEPCLVEFIGRQANIGGCCLPGGQEEKTKKVEKVMKRYLAVYCV
jgi:Mycoplasma protein of unknown function, DUF285